MSKVTKEQKEWIESHSSLFADEDEQRCHVCGTLTFVCEDVGVALYICSEKCRKEWWHEYRMAAAGVPSGVLAVDEKTEEIKDES